MTGPIETSDDHKLALVRIDQLMDAEPDTPELAEPEVLAIVVQRYEREKYRVESIRYSVP